MGTDIDILILTLVIGVVAVLFGLLFMYALSIDVLRKAIGILMIFLGIVDYLSYEKITGVILILTGGMLLFVKWKKEKTGKETKIKFQKKGRQ